jgi:CheY-like chemotaxis protein
MGQLEQVVMNLAINAQDAMPEGGILTLRTEAVELDEAYARGKKGVTPGFYVKVAVSDTGSGMSAETMERVFEPFFTTKEKGKGTGLGLSTAYGIVKQHGGNIWAYSENGLGTTIKVYLPVPEESFEPSDSSSQARMVPAGSEVVLLVEDDRQVRNLSSVILQRQGYHVLVAQNGEEALSLLKDREGPLDLLLTDVIMPDMNGKELFEKVSALYPDAGVLYMSGYTDDVIAHHGVIDEGVHFIEKPFTVRALAAKVREVLDK